LVILDISNPSKPTQTGFFNTSGYARDVEVVGDLAYVADYNRGLVILDISNPSKPTQTGFFNTSGYANDVEVMGDLAYVADADGGLVILDISNPSKPTQTGIFDTGVYAYDVEVVGGLAYVADDYGGLVILDVSDFTQTPVVNNPIPDLTATTGETLNYKFPKNTFSDPDGDALTYSVDQLPSGLTFDPETRTFSGIPTKQGNFNVTVFASDGKSSISDTFKITISVPESQQVIGTNQNDTLKGTNLDNFLDGLVGNDRLFGLDGDDLLSGGSGGDFLTGGEGNDILRGDVGNDILRGDVGNDFLRGGEGNDTFVFNSPAEGVDRIKDFESDSDKIKINSGEFGGNLGVGILEATQFVLGATPQDSDDRFIYKLNTGELFFDVDGKGGIGQVKIAILEGYLLKFSDIEIV
jgi:Ca2+-binding RTX toxin-like protein